MASMLGGLAVAFGGQPLLMEPTMPAPVTRCPDADKLLGYLELKAFIALNELEDEVVAVVTKDRPDLVVLIEAAAARLTVGDTTEAVALAMRRLLDQDARTGSLFGHQRGSVRVLDGVDLTDPTFSEVDVGRVF